MTYGYVRDESNSKRRYITTVETAVTRGFVVKSGRMLPLAIAGAQTVRNETVYTSDGRYNVAARIDSLGRTATHSYNDFNQVVETADFDRHKTHYVYDIPSNPSPSQPINYDTVAISKENLVRSVTATNPVKFNETVETLKQMMAYAKYSSASSPISSDQDVVSTHRLLSLTNELGSKWTYTYDDVNNFNPLSPTSKRTPTGSVCAVRRNQVGDVVTYIDAEGNVTKFDYNPQGKITLYTDPNQNTIKLEYYPCGDWLYRFTDQLAKVTEFGRDTNGRITSIVDPVGDSTEYQYYANGRIRKIRKHRPRLTSAPLGSKGRLPMTPFPNLEYIIDYSPLGRACYFRNPKKLEIIFAYDEVGRLSSWYENVTSPKYVKFAYDEAGQLLNSADKKGRVTTCSYYRAGYLQSVQYPDWSDGTRTIRGKKIVYKVCDYFGRPLSVSDSEIRGSMECVYDLVGNLTFRRDPDGYELSLTYDKEGRLFDVSDFTEDFRVTLARDKLGRIASLRDSSAIDGALTWKYAYRKQVGAATKVLRLFERSVPSLGLKTEFDYDGRNQLTSIKSDFSKRSLAVENYSYRDDGLIAQILSAQPDSFTYDGVKQLVYEAGPDLASDYNEAGNRLFRASPVSNPRPCVYDVLNRLQREPASGGVFTYDDDGNTVIASYPTGDVHFAFDGTGSLRYATSKTFKIFYLYDNDGNLVRRSRVIGPKRRMMQTSIYRYLLGRPIIIQDRNAAKILTWDLDGSLLRIRDPNLASNSARYRNSTFAIYDGFRNVRQLVDASGTQIAAISYDVWGNTVSAAGQASDIPYGWKSLFIDPDTRLVRSGVRWYRPTSGRWLSPDPIPSTGVNPDRLISELTNLYSYVSNNPANRTDTSGLSQDDSSRTDQTHDEATTPSLATVRRLLGVFSAVAKVLGRTDIEILKRLDELQNDPGFAEELFKEFPQSQWEPASKIISKLSLLLGAAGAVAAVSAAKPEDKLFVGVKSIVSLSSGYLGGLAAGEFGLGLVEGGLLAGTALEGAAVALPVGLALAGGWWLATKGETWVKEQFGR